MKIETKYASPLVLENIYISEFHVSTLTSQPGMTPIVLPAMNIVAMLQDRS